MAKAGICVAWISDHGTALNVVDFQAEIAQLVLNASGEQIDATIFEHVTLDCRRKMHGVKDLAVVLLERRELHMLAFNRLAVLDGDHVAENLDRFTDVFGPMLGGSAALSLPAGEQIKGMTEAESEEFELIIGFVQGMVRQAGQRKCPNGLLKQRQTGRRLRFVSQSVVGLPE